MWSSNRMMLWTEVNFDETSPGRVVERLSLSLPGKDHGRRLGHIHGGTVGKA